MPKPSIVIFTTLLIGTNAWWLYKFIDIGVTVGYQDQELYETRHQIATLKILSTHLIQGTPKQDAGRLLQTLFPSEQSFEKEGALNTAWLALQLSPDGKVVAVKTNP